MSRVLELLLAQAEAQGCDLVTLRAIIEEAAEIGARRGVASAIEARRAETLGSVHESAVAEPDAQRRADD